MRSVNSEVWQLNWSSQLLRAFNVVPWRARWNRFKLRGSTRDASIRCQKVFIAHLTATDAKVDNYLIAVDTQLFHTMISVDQLPYYSLVLLVCHWLVRVSSSNYGCLNTTAIDVRQTNQIRAIRPHLERVPSFWFYHDVCLLLVNT